MFTASFFRSALRPLHVAVLVLSALVAQAQSPSAADGFDPNVDGNVYVMATQPDGKLIIAGQFTTVRPSTGPAAVRNNIARLNPDGSLDVAFDPNAASTIRALILQPNGQVLIGGDFTSLRPNGVATATVRNRVARLNTDGTLDASFNPNVGGGNFPQVNALALQPNGKVVVGGRFATVQSGATTVAVTRNHLARFNADGSLDAAYNPNPNSLVLALVSQLEASNFVGAARVPTGDGKIVIAGGFTTLQPSATGAVTARNRIARLNADGTVDTEFNPDANNSVATLAVQRDGKIVLGGTFTTLQPIGSDIAATRNRIARLNANGTLDTEFFPNVGGSVLAVAVAPDGGVMVGGYFTSVWGRGTVTTQRNYVARLFPDGTLDTGFSAGVNYAVSAFAFQPDGKIILGGYFTAAQSKGLSTAAPRNRVARFHYDGTLDTTFALDAGGRPLVTLVQPDGKIIIGGSFASVGGVTRNYLARLNADGSVDGAFAPPSPNGRVLALARQSDGKLIVAGAFNLIGTTTRNNLARLNTDGSLDTAFDPNANGQIGVLTMQSDGKILVGGNFTSLTPTSTTITPGATPGSTTATSADGSQTVTTTTFISTTNGVTTTVKSTFYFRNYLARLNADGSVDSFNPGASSTVSAIVLQGDGKILVAGAFNAFTPNSGSSTSSQSFIARLNTDGLVDTTFAPLVNARATSLALQSDGKVIVGGQFTLFQPPGASSTTVNGVTTSTAIQRHRLLRLNSDGTIDSTYAPDFINGVVLALALQSDGRVLVGGSFTGIQSVGDATWTLRKYAARLGTDGKLDTTFNLDLSEANGNRVDSIAVQRVGTDDKVLIGGSFVSLQPAGTTTRIAANQFVRINGNGSLDTTFNPGAGGSTGGQIAAMAQQTDGKIVAVGSFTDIGGTRTTNVARFNAEGTADTLFSSSLDADGPVAAVLHRPDTAPVATQGNGLAWLTRDGALRTGFTLSAKLTGTVKAIAVEADGNILLGGVFTNEDKTTYGNLVRVSPTGVLDSSFLPPLSGEVAAIAIQSDKKILIGGAFTGIGSTTRNRAARLNPNGTLDTTFDPNLDARVNAIVVQGDGKIVLGGAFTTVQPSGAATTTERKFIARFDGAGALDTTYNPSASATINTLLLQADGQIVAGGSFTSFNPGGATTTTATARNYLARLKTDGTLDTFDPGASGAVNALALYLDGKIIVGGAFNSFTPNALGNSTVRNFIARLNPDGTVDANFDPNTNGPVYTVAVQPDGAVLFGGTFSALQPNNAVEFTVRNRLARVDFSGALDTAFNPDANGAVEAIAVRPDGTLIVVGNLSTVRPNGVMLLGGNFQNIGGVASRNLALINDDGTVGTAFQPNPNGAVTALLTLPSGSTLVGGAFTTIAGATRNRLARFNNDNTLDTGYAPNIGGTGTVTVNAVAAQPDGRVLVGGSFTTANGAARTNLARILPDGSTDAAFNPTVGIVRGLIIQGDGRILVLAGTTVSRLNSDGTADASFTAFNGGTTALNAIALQADGRVLVGGAFAGFIARLNANGTRDTAFDPQADGAVTALTLQPDGRVLVGGAFNRIGGLVRAGLARLAASTPASQSFAVNAARTGVTWTRSGTATEVSSVTIARSDDGLTWSSPVNATRVAASGAWTAALTAQPASGNFYIRARAVVTSGGGTSSGLTESVAQINLANVLAAEIPNTPVVPVPAPPGGTLVPVVPPSVTPPATGIPPTTSGAPVVGFRVVPDTAALTQAITAAQLTTTPGSATLARLSNLSTRARVAAGNDLLTGFSINGTGDRTVLVRAVGPGLTGFGVTGALAAPLLRIMDAAGNILVENNGWSGAALSQAAAASGAFPLTPGSADAAILVTLAAGAYTIQVTDANGTNGGIALAEVYDVAGGSASRLANVSSRSALSSADGTLISGFVIAGTTNENLLVRGVGPGLTQFGVTSALTDPQIGIYDSTGRSVATNDNWSTNASNTNALAASATSVGAFALTSGSKDAAVMLTLAPGAYTAQVSAASGTTGGALLEIYELK